MRTCPWLALAPLMMAFGFAVFALGHTAGNLPSAELHAELLALETSWDDALVQKDRAALDRIIADDFVLIAADGQLANKRRLLETIVSPDLQLDAFKTEDVLVRVYGEVAILTGYFRQTGSFKNSRFASTSRYTDVYVKRDGRWQAVSAQATALPPSAAASL
jgi:ketosteroid isomerase-like protein